MDKQTGTTQLYLDTFNRFFKRERHTTCNDHAIDFFNQVFNQLNLIRDLGPKTSKLSDRL
jgi:hypothetical protein